MKAGFLCSVDRYFRAGLTLDAVQRAEFVLLDRLFAFRLDLKSKKILIG